MYATPHTWTAFAREQADRGVVQENQLYWDYRHQVLDQAYLRPWQLFAAVKWWELSFHLRPRRLGRLLLTRDRGRRQQAWWTARHTLMVWLAEIVEFVRRTRFARRPVPLGQWWPIESQPLHASANRATLLPLYEGGNDRSRVRDHG
jgi:anaerobic magnesium-protoporphyrin IX monomethyl ester cyclase